ncbi:MAG: NUDIX domain-containing protein [Thermodesulfovibrionales bacterium]
MDEEFLEVVNEQGEVLFLRARSEIHGDPSLMHRVVHVLVFNLKGELLLQKRSMRKDVAPGRWDTSVGGHVDPGETPHKAALRELEEELGVRAEPEFLYSYVHTNPYETEMVHTFRCFHDGAFSFNREEIDEVRFWSIESILSQMEGEALSDNFKHELSVYLETWGR